MHGRFLYILVALITAILYEFYLIGFYKYQDFQTNSYVHSLEEANASIENRNREKDLLNLYIRTKAYQTLVAKSTQNKKLPNEEVMNIISENDVQSNAPVDVHEVMFDIKKQEDSPTKGMSNPEKWWYYLTSFRV